jgi:hypothetical protein
MRHWTTSFHFVDAGLEDKVFEPPPSTRYRIVWQPLRSYFSLHWMLSYDIRVCEVLRSYMRLELEQAVAYGAPAPGTGPTPLVSNTA